MKSTRILIISLLTTLAFAAGCPNRDCPVCPDNGSAEVEFSTIEGHEYFSIPGSGTIFITEEIDWLNLWVDYWTLQDGGEKTAPPDIDFDTEMVIGVHWAETSGCTNESESIRFLLLDGDVMHVVVDEMADLGPCDMIVYPIHLVKTARRSVTLNFLGEVPPELPPM